MDEGIELPITYNDKDYLFPARLIRFGYTYRIEVDVDGTIVSFERDEERNWRALINPETDNPKIEPGLLNAIVQTLDSI